METGSYISTIDSNSDLTIRGNGTVKTIRTSKTVTTDSGIVNDDQTSTFVAVTDILGIPSTQASYSLTLSPSVQPTNASYQTVTWSIDSGLNTAGASISNDRVLTAVRDGQVRLLATIDNGKAIGTAYTKSFTVTFSYGSGTVTQPEPSTPETVDKITKGDSKTSYKANDTIELFANIKGGTLGTDKVTWESLDTSYVTITPDTTDSTKATAKVLKTDNSGAKDITITAKVGNTTPASIVIKVQAEGTIDTTITSVKGITITGKDGANASAAQNENVFTATAELNRDLQSGETVKWTFKESEADSLATKVVSTDTKTATITISSNAQKTATQKLTVQAVIVKNNENISAQIEKEITIAATGGSTNPPSETIGLSEITATPATINLNSSSKTSALSVSLTGTNTEGYTVAWSVDKPAIATIAAGTDTKTATLTGVTAGNVTVTAKLMKNGTEVTPKVEKTKTITITSTSDTSGATLTGIEVNGDKNSTTFETKSYNDIVLKPIGNNLTGKTVDWSMNKKQGYNIGGTGFKFGYSIDSTATEVPVTSDVNFKVGSDAAPGVEVFTVVATIHGETGEGKTISRKFTVAQRPAVQSITLNGATVGNKNTATVSPDHSITLDTPYDLNAAVVSPSGALPDIIWAVDESSGKFSQQGSLDPKDIIWSINAQNKLTLSVNTDKQTQITIPDSVTVIWIRSRYSRP